MRNARSEYGGDEGGGINLASSLEEGWPYVGRGADCEAETNNDCEGGVFPSLFILPPSRTRPHLHPDLLRHLPLARTCPLPSPAPPSSCRTLPSTAHSSSPASTVGEEQEGQRGPALPLPLLLVHLHRSSVALVLALALPPRAPESPWSLCRPTLPTRTLGMDDTRALHTQ
ncbi:hypothetical protein K438DRAFT_2002591 [Mycena galopus ATCC 62051]|nr:hypothetical protein K438DRAFT_2002591 [Mycena galopus ATCC 62051]